MEKSIEFLHEPANIVQRIRSLVGSSDCATLAVAYWGDGAVQNLRLDSIDQSKRSAITIICDLMSGACNPSTIKEIMELGYSARKKGGLHSKVYWTPKAAIVGSSNVSASGMLFAGIHSIKINQEANLIVKDVEVLSQIRSWLDRIEMESELIDDSDIAEAKTIWEARQRTAWNVIPTNRAKSRLNLLDKMRDDPDFFSDKEWYFLVYAGTDRSEQSERKLEAKKRQGPLEKLKDALDVYELEEKDDKEPYRPTNVLFDIYVTTNGSFKYQSCSKCLDVLSETTADGSTNHYVRLLGNKRNLDFDAFQVNAQHLEKILTPAIEYWIKSKMPKLEKEKWHKRLDVAIPIRELAEIHSKLSSV